MLSGSMTRRGSDLFVKLQICDVFSSYSPACNAVAHTSGATASADNQASFADAVNVAAFFLTNSCTLIGPCPVSVCTSSDIRL